MKPSHPLPGAGSVGKLRQEGKGLATPRNARQPRESRAHRTNADTDGLKVRSWGTSSSALEIPLCLEDNFYQLSKIHISAPKALKTWVFQLGVEQT